MAPDLLLSQLQSQFPLQSHRNKMTGQNSQKGNTQPLSGIFNVIDAHH